MAGFPLARDPAGDALVQGKALAHEGLGGLSHDDREDQLVLVRVDEEGRPVEWAEEGADVLHDAVEDPSDRVFGDNARPDGLEDRELDEVVHVHVPGFLHAALLDWLIPNYAAF